MKVDAPLRTFFDKFAPIAGYAEAVVRPWNYAVAAGDVSGAVPLNLAGWTTGINSIIWRPGGASYVWQTADQQPWLVSSDADDTAAGNGARTVRVTWLNSAGTEATEDIALNGAAAVQMVANTVRRINKAEVLTAGTSGVNEGAISVYATDGATRMAYIYNYEGTSQTTIQTVPAGKRDVITKMSGGYRSSTAAVVGRVCLRARDVGAAFYVRLSFSGRRSNPYTCPYPVVLEAGTDYYFYGEADDNDYALNVSGWREVV